MINRQFNLLFYKVYSVAHLSFGFGSGNPQALPRHFDIRNRTFQSIDSELLSRPSPLWL
jgi:hypothetical protein